MSKKEKFEQWKGDWKNEKGRWQSGQAEFFEQIRKRHNLEKRLEAAKKDKFITIPKEEFESMEATIETLRDREVLKGIEKSRKEIKQGKYISLDELMK